MKTKNNNTRRRKREKKKTTNARTPNTSSFIFKVAFSHGQTIARTM